MNHSDPVQMPRRHFTVADYHRLGEVGILGEGERVELIEGDIIDMTPIGSTHAGRVKRLTRLLAQAVGDRAILAVQDPVVLGDDSEPEPALALLRPRADFFTDSHPNASDVLLLIEVADTSLRIDRDIKVPLYAHHGIPEVWILAIDDRQLLRFALLPGLTHCTLDLTDLI